MSLSDCLYFVRYWAVSLLQLLVNITNFEIKLIFLIKPVFLHDQKLKTKTF